MDINASCILLQLTVKKMSDILLVVKEGLPDFVGTILKVIVT